MSPDDGEKRIQGLSSLIGNTPLLSMRFRYKGEERTVFTKAEHLNMTGSIKDRMAFHILKKGYERGALRPGDMIIEATSGNTGIKCAVRAKININCGVTIGPANNKRNFYNLILFESKNLSLLVMFFPAFSASVRLS